jgi:sigma-E factor negative regulatory protein RseB
MRAGRLLLTLSFSLLALNFSLFSADAQAEEGARGWLERMTQAFQQQNYRGVLIYGDGQQWQTLAITHGMLDGVEQEKLLHLTGLPREMVRHGQDIICIHPGEHSPRFNSELSNPLHGFSRVMDVEDQYHFTLGGVERIAGRFAQRLQVTPVDNDRYGYQLWLDQNTGLLLRSDLLNNHQQVLERFQFAQIEIGLDLSAADFEPDDQGHKLTLYPVSPDQQTISTDGIGWLPNWIPAGFRITAVIQAGSPRTADADADAEQRTADTLPVRLMYSDGLAAFTLFIDPVNQEQMPEITRRWGATAAVVRYRDHTAGAADGDGSSHGRLRVTVVGELPADTMIRIATSIVPGALAEHHVDAVNSALSVTEE